MSEEQVIKHHKKWLQSKHNGHCPECGRDIVDIQLFGYGSDGVVELLPGDIEKPVCLNPETIARGEPALFVYFHGYSVDDFDAAHDVTTENHLFS